jgi:hypothetical protein
MKKCVENCGMENYSDSFYGDVSTWAVWLANSELKRMWRPLHTELSKYALTVFGESETFSNAVIFKNMIQQYGKYDKYVFLSFW